MKKTVLIFALWTMICGLVYVLNQDHLRQSANDPQTQVVRDMSDRLSAQTTQPTDYDTATKMSIANSLSPFVMVFDSGGTVLASSGQLNGQPLSVPLGVLDYVATKSSDGLPGGAEYAVTLQPQKGVRLAAVFKVVPLNVPGAQYVTVMAARSLREVELRELITATMVGVVWMLGMVLIVVFGVYEICATKKKEQ